MNVSRNELSAALKKAFEALGFEPGDYYDAADMVVWLQTHGFYGFDRLQAALSYLNTNAPTHAELVREDESTFVLNGKGTSILLCGSEAVNLVTSRAIEGGTVSLDVVNCFNRSFVIQRLLKATRRNVAFIAYWRQHSHAVKVSVSPSADLPIYQLFTKASHLNEQSLRILAGPSIDRIEEDYSWELSLGDSHEEFSSADMRRCYQESIEHGIEIDHDLWCALDSLGTQVLVESNDGSRSGAGD